MAIIGHPVYKTGDIVAFDIDFNGNGEMTELTGEVWIVDAWGTFEQNEEPSYDVFVEERNTLFKHLRESIVRDAG